MKKILISLFFILSINPIFGAEQPHKTREELIQDFTNVMTALYQKLVDTNIIIIEHLKKLERADKLISPLTQEERNGLSSDQLVRIKELEARLNVPVIMPQINGWARKTIMALTGEQETQKRVHEDTREVHRPMRFVEISAGKYVDHITDEAFEIPEGVEIQDTPVTQWQWFKERGTNPAHFINGNDSIEINKIKMLPNAPVENVSWNDVQAFIKKLNEKNDGYVYALPSVQEYQSVMQKTFGLGMDSIYPPSPRAKADTHHDRALTSSGRPECSATLRECEAKTNVSKGGAEEKTHAVPLFNHKKEIFDAVGNVWQWTRDYVENSARWNFADHIFASQEKTLMKVPAHLAFGASYATDTTKISSVKDIMRPILYNNTKGQSIGFRLIRYKKPLLRKDEVYRYDASQFSWNQSDELVDANWCWDAPTKQLIFYDDGLLWAFMHEKEYSTQLQHTLDDIRDALNVHVSVDDIKQFTKELEMGKGGLKYVLFGLVHKNIQDITLLKYLPRYTCAISLFGNNIEDISSLAHITNLTMLNIAFNPIKDLGPLKSLKNLKSLALDKNQSKRLQAHKLLPNVTIIEI